ncbi:unnamed protein product [Leptidea sinapis]|uniref:Major facilitator superfamily (MFS) profile domain-containing protein n=1 Tax=Leptidea sinapis TaxID=189913 RepID=A0A5E4QUU2_9NEOP|nr:unnamed protein product [Leptidea sinapis]
MAGVGSLLGSFSGHMLSIFFNWRTVALLGLIPTMLSCILPFFWVESPSWLASKGRFDESRKSFKKLHYMDKENEKELENLIALEKTKVVALKSNSANTPAKTIWRACQQLYLWKIIFLCLMTNVYRVAAGRILFNTMALTIFQDFTGESKLWLVTLLIDGFGILGALLSCVFDEKFVICIRNNRPDVDGETAWIKACLLALYLIIVNSGPYPVLETILAEVYPLEAKAFCIFIVGSVTGAMQFLAINLAQKMFASIGYHGSFLINSFLTFVSLVYLWVYLPETKGKTLQEIELYFKKGFIDSVELDNSDKDCDFKIMLRDTLKETDIYPEEEQINEK